MCYGVVLLIVGVFYGCWLVYHCNISFFIIFCVVLLLLCGVRGDVMDNCIICL